MANSWMTVVLMTVLIGIASFGIIRLSRSRTLRRWKSLLDVYADREMQGPKVSRR